MAVLALFRLTVPFIVAVLALELSVTQEERMKLEAKPKMKTQKIEENIIMNPAFLLGIAFKIA